MTMSFIQNHLLRALPCAAFLFLVAASPASAASEPVKPEYLENNQIRIGVDMGAGGSIFYVSEKVPERNLLNHFDKGRFIQQSYYGADDDSLWNGKRWRWNPVQGGGYKNEPAKVLATTKGEGEIYVKSRPKHWATGVDIEDATMEEWISLKGKVARVHFKLTYSGTTSHPNRHQELPAAFVDAALTHLVLYKGDKPWTGDALTRKVPGWPNESARADESWAAYVDDKDWGIGFYFPEKKNLTTYRYRGNGITGPTGADCSYFAPVESFAITPGLVHEYDFFISIGEVAELRLAFLAIHDGSMGSRSQQSSSQTASKSDYGPSPTLAK